MRSLRFQSVLTALIAGFAALTVSHDALALDRTSGRGGLCAGLAGFQCKAGLFCDFAPSAQCGAADQTGTCRRKPEICAMIYEPVCGCDDKTYGNDCQRRAAGVGKVKNGPCKPTG